MSFRLLPSVDTLLHLTETQKLVQEYGQQACLVSIRTILQELRQQVAAEVQASPDIPTPEEKQAFAEEVVRMLAHRLQQQLQTKIRRVFNGSGVVLHTNLGRALLPESAIAAVTQVMRYPCTIEYDLAEGQRGDRDHAIEQLLCQLTGAEAATVVNNNAAAVLLILAALAPQKEVLVSRGELVEIGGSFRIPDVMRQAGSQLVEVGTTNRTHAKDYQGAISHQTAALMKVHCSNYRIEGFTASVSVEEMAQIAHQHQLWCLVDAGSGTLIDCDYLAHLQEPTVRQLMQQGADIVTFSGDKLLGGVQAGFIVGSRKAVDACKKHPLKRALRVDKLTMAALEAVLQHYLQPETLAQTLPTHFYLQRTPQDIWQQAERLRQKITVPEGWLVEVVPMQTQIGSGALPTETLASAGWKISLPESTRISIVAFEKRLRSLPIPWIGRVQQQAFWYDFRCLSVAEEEEWLAQWSLLLLSFVES